MPNFVKLRTYFVLVLVRFMVMNLFYLLIWIKASLF